MDKGLLKLFIANFTVLFLGFLIQMLMGFSLAPSVVDVYYEFAAELPVFTMMYLRIFDFAKNWWFIVFPSAFFVILLVSFLVSLLLNSLNNKTINTVYFIGILLLTVLIFALIGVSLYLPLFQVANTF